MRHGSTLACYPGIPVADGDKNGCLAVIELAPGAPARATAHPLSRAGNPRIR
jgi:hypothetical protein